MSQKIFDRSKHQKQVWRNPDYRKHMSDIHKQLWGNFKYRKHMSDVHKGKTGYWKDKKRSKETIEKMKKGRKGKSSGSKHWNWKGGKLIHNGHIYILQKKHPFCEHHGYVPRSHLVMEKFLGRYLKPEERVHHKGIKYSINSIKNKQDDRPENLRLFTNENEHQLFHYKLRKINKLGQFI